MFSLESLSSDCRAEQLPCLASWHLFKQRFINAEEDAAGMCSRVRARALAATARDSVSPLTGFLLYQEEPRLISRQEGSESNLEAGWRS